MDLICSAATACSIRLYITQSFRLSNSGLQNVVYDPAPHSNHLVGYAIDMNTVSANGYLCNYACLGQTTKLPSDVTCFLGKIRASPPLRYGGDFTTQKKDWVHIDAGPFYQTNPTGYMALYNEIRQECYGITPSTQPTTTPRPPNCDPTVSDCSSTTPTSDDCDPTLSDCSSTTPTYDDCDPTVSDCSGTTPTYDDCDPTVSDCSGTTPTYDDCDPTVSDCFGTTPAYDDGGGDDGGGDDGGGDDGGGDDGGGDYGGSDRKRRRRSVGYKRALRKALRKNRV